MQIEKGKPLTLPDGTLILPEANAEGSKVVSVEEQQDEREVEQMSEELEEILVNPIKADGSTVMKRTLADVPVEFKQMNIYMLVASYTMWGLDTYAISRILETQEFRVQAVRESDQCEKLMQEMIEAIRYAEAASVHGYLSSKAHEAAVEIVKSMKSKKGEIKLAAAKDVLDRAGFRPADRVEHVHRFEDELRIVHLKQQDNTNIEVDL